ncbi:MAG: hypothetical protein FWD61_00720 [Phycisphaerales bacterium]|nr:hypothetical protein [Phycisphaerales bacterium]
MSQATATTDTHPLVERITRMRSRVRTVVGLFGGGVLVSAGVGGMAGLMMGDYLIHLSAMQRLVLMIMWVMALGAIAWRVLIHPLSTRLTDQFLASRVENVHKDLEDELMSAVHFIHAGTTKTNALAARHVDAAAAKTASIRFEEAIDFRRSGKALGIAALVVVVTTMIVALNPNLGRIALSRWFSASPLDWPRFTTVMFAWGTEGNKPPTVLPIGEQLLVQAKVVQGGSPSQRVYLRAWGDHESARSELMTYQPAMSGDNEFVYERTLEPRGERTLSLKIEAGDDTEQPPVNIRLAPRPIINELTASITPPDYVRDLKDASKPAPAVTTDMMIREGRAVEGATVKFRIHATKPFLCDDRGERRGPEVKLLSDAKDVDVSIGSSRRLIDANTAEMTFQAKESWNARIIMRDTDGFENHAGGTVRLVVVPDGLPSVVITEPRRLSDRSPTAMVSIVVQGTDDLGLDGVKLVAEKYNAKPGDAPVFETPLAWAELTVDQASGSTSGRANYRWDLSLLNLQPEARLSFYAMVQDNYSVNGTRHPWVKSGAMTLQIRSASDIEREARQQLNDIKDRIKSLKAAEEKNQGQTDVIKAAAEKTGVTTAQQKEQLAQLSQQESQQASTAMSIQQKLEQIRGDLAENKLTDGELAKLAQTISQGMNDIGQNDMPKAASELGKAHDAAGNQEPGKQNEQSKSEAKQTAQAASNASQKQAEAIAKMENMIDQLGAAGDLAEAQRVLRDIKARQDKLNTDTNRTAIDTRGKDVKDLTPDEKKRLDALANRQQQLHQETQSAIKDMEDSARRAKQNDPAASESLSQAARSGRENDVPGKQDEASKNISKNQTATASGNQGQASQGLQQMLDELNKNEKRALEQLQRQLADLIREVKKLKNDQEQIKDDTEAAGGRGGKNSKLETRNSKLGDRQETLHMNTIVVQKKALNTKDGKEAAADIRDAAEQMGLAAAALYGNKQPAAIAPEDNAVACLAEAIKKLENLKEKVDNALKTNDLAEFIKKYEAIRDAQINMKKTTDNVESRRLASEEKEFDHLGLKQLADLVKTQQDQIDRIAKLSSDEKLKEYDIVVWMNGQIIEAMGTSKTGLSKAQLGRQIASAQQTAIDRIQDIIDALKEEKNKSEFEQDSNGGGGSGNGGQQKRPLLPPIAQMKLIKAMQKIVITQTVNVDKALQTATSESEKTRLKEEAAKIGKTQGDLKAVVKKTIEQMQ